MTTHLNVGYLSHFLGLDSKAVQECVELVDGVRLDMLFEQRYRLVNGLRESIVLDQRQIVVLQIFQQLQSWIVFLLFHLHL